MLQLLFFRGMELPIEALTLYYYVSMLRCYFYSVLTTKQRLQVQIYYENRASVHETLWKFFTDFYLSLQDPFRTIIEAA